MELTKEHFDRVLQGLATKKDLEGMAAKEDLKAMATKKDLEGLATKESLIAAITASEQRIVKRIDESQEELARMVSGGFDDVQRRLDVMEHIKTFELKFKKLEEALHIKL